MSVTEGALLVPQRAVTEIQGKYLLAVVGADNKVDIRPVTRRAHRFGLDHQPAA
jgi:multidrug efflux pump subunit AcrA (membrane-fusion protein)